MIDADDLWRDPTALPGKVEVVPYTDRAVPVPIGPPVMGGGHAGVLSMNRTNGDNNG